MSETRRRMPRRHPAEITAGRLVDATERWPDYFDGASRDMVGQLVHILDQIASGVQR